MTGHRDPIEHWLSQDVEVLPPPPGAFQRVRSRARRRKAMRAAGAAAGVAVIVAAGISVPALTGNLFPGPGPARVRTGQPTASSSTRAPLSSPRITPGKRYFPGPQLAGAGNGPAAPAGFRPASATFVGNGAGHLGAVLGQAPCGRRLCTAMAGTASYGSRWTRIGAPPVGPAAVSQVRFADPRNGWAFGPALYATHDGGATWHAIRMRGVVVDLAAVGNRAFAMVARGGTGCDATWASGGCIGFALYSASVTGDGWAEVPGGAGSGRPVVPGGLQLTRQGAYLIAGGRIYAGPLTGGAWHEVPRPGSGAPSCLTSPAALVRRLLAPGRSALYLACGATTGSGTLFLYASRDGGRTWQPLGPGPVQGWTATSLAVSPAGHLVLAAGTGLYYSGSGSSWSPVGGSAAGVGFRYVGMTTSLLGVAVPSSSSSHIVYVTRDGGHTWRPSQISP